MVGGRNVVTQHCQHSSACEARKWAKLVRDMGTRHPASITVQHPSCTQPLESAIRYGRDRMTRSTCRINVQYRNVGGHTTNSNTKIRRRQGTASATTEHGSFLAALTRGLRRPDILQRVVVPRSFKDVREVASLSWSRDTYSKTRGMCQNTFTCHVSSRSILLQTTLAYRFALVIVIVRRPFSKRNLVSSCRHEGGPRTRLRES